MQDSLLKRLTVGAFNALVLIYLIPSFSAFSTCASVTQPTSECEPEACFIVGQAKFPKDVVVNPEVDCLKGKEPFEGVPDVTFNGVKYSDVDFQNDKSLSPVGFALEHFETCGDKDDLAHFQALNAVYGATNAGLRSIGDAPSRKSLKKLKGAHFFIEFQLTRIQNNINGPQGTAHKLKKAFWPSLRIFPLRNGVNIDKLIFNQ